MYMETMNIQNTQSPDRTRRFPEYDVMELLRPFLATLKEGDRMLDLGAGSGLQVAKAMNQGVDVVAVDIADRPKDLEATGIEWLNKPLEEYIAALTPDQQFDGVLLQNIIHFFPKEYVLKVLLPTVLAHTKVGACIAIETMSKFPDPPLNKFQTTYSPQELIDALGGDTLLSEQVDTQRAEDAGFLRTFHHTRVIIRKTS